MVITNSNNESRFGKHSGKPMLRWAQVDNFLTILDIQVLWFSLKIQSGSAIGLDIVWHISSRMLTGQYCPPRNLHDSSSNHGPSKYPSVASKPAISTLSKCPHLNPIWILKKPWLRIIGGISIWVAKYQSFRIFGDIPIFHQAVDHPTRPTPPIPPGRWQKWYSSEHTSIITEPVLLPHRVTSAWWPGTRCYSSLWYCNIAIHSYESHGLFSLHLPIYIYLSMLSKALELLL